MELKFNISKQFWRNYGAYLLGCLIAALFLDSAHFMLGAIIIYPTAYYYGFQEGKDKI